MNKKKLIILGVIILGISLLITANILKSKNVGIFAGGKAIEVAVTIAKIEDINSEVSVNGIVEEVAKEEVYFDTSVKVTNVYVEKNDVVTAGQKLVDFDMDDLNSQVEQARINLNMQNITLSKIEDGFKLQNTSQSSSVLEQSRLAMENAKSNFERVEKLYNEGAASLVEYQNSKMSYDNAVLQYNTAQNNVGDLNINNTNLESNHEKDVAAQKEQIKLTQLRLNDLENKISKLRKQSISPIDGVISVLNIQKGSITNPAVMGIKITNPNYLQAKLEVKEVDIQKIKVGQNVEITGDAFQDSKMNGYVKSIGSIAQKKQGMNTSDEAFIEVTVTVDNTNNALRPGLSVNANIITETRKNAVVVPFDTFQEDKDGNKWVFAIENGTARKKNVKTGISSNLSLEVLSGLSGNEKLVQDPPSRLKDGMKVVVK